jgi:hypothetical protein
MAVAITRQARVDDDGSGTTGTVINAAFITAIYDEIDAALAAVQGLGLPLAGGTVAGNVTFSAGYLAFSGDSTGTTGPSIFRSSNQLVIRGATSNILFTNRAGSLVNMTLSDDGRLVVGAGAAVTPAHMTVNYPGATRVGLALNDPDSLSNTAFLYFTLAGTTIGAVLRNGSTSAVQYLTTSDRRLKTDRGVAQNVSALRSVVVHDFDWTASGVHDRGVFAQEAHAFYPQAITVGDDTMKDGHLVKPWMADYSKFVPDLIVGWQQHDGELATLKARIAALEAKAA